MAIREKPHRLPKEFYQGGSTVAFTLCPKDRTAIFSNREVVDIFMGFLKNLTAKYNCKIPVYCFMPDHLHLIIHGTDDVVDLLKAISDFKQKPGFGCQKITWERNGRKIFSTMLLRKMSH